MNMGTTTVTQEIRKVNGDSERKERMERKRNLREKEKGCMQQERTSCITRIHFPPSENTKPYFLQSLMDDYFNSHSKSFNFVA